MAPPGGRNVQDELNRMAPAARDARLGDVINDLITQHNNLLAALIAAAIGGLNLSTVQQVTPLASRLDHG